MEKRINEMNLPAASVNEPLFGMNVNCPDVQKPIIDAIEALSKYGPSREFALVKTKLHEALFWLKAAERGEFSAPQPAAGTGA
jgi:hypothetical protein